MGSRLIKISSVASRIRINGRKIIFWKLKQENKIKMGTYEKWLVERKNQEKFTM